MFKNNASLLLAIVGIVFTSWVFAGEEGLRDPTRPLGYYGDGRVAAQRLELHSILISADRKLTIINGQTLRENDLIKGVNGIRIARIEANDVLLQQGDKQWRLSLNTRVRQ